MARRYRRRHRYTVARPLKTTKYSSETYATAVNIIGSGPIGTHGTFTVPVLPNTIGGVLGTRKAKNFTLRLCTEQSLIQTPGAPGDTFERGRVAFALVFVPEGTTASPINFGSGNAAVSLYEPNQNVILGGVIDSQQTYSFKTRLARNLNAGDNIVLILYDLYSVGNTGEVINTPVAITCNYAISF